MTILNKCRLCGAAAVEQERGQMGPGDYKEMQRINHKGRYIDDPDYFRDVHLDDYNRSDIRVSCSECDNATPWNRADPPGYPGAGIGLMRLNWNESNPGQAMKVSGTVAYGAVATVYEGEPGDKLPWHQHSVPHGHVVIRGRTLLEIEGEPPLEMTPELSNRELPPIIPHQITVLDPDTIFLNMIAAGDASESDLAKGGGVLLDDGTVVY